MKRSDRFILIVLAVLLGLILILLIQGDRAGVKVTAVIPAEGEQVGVYGPIGIQFSNPVDKASAESHFSTTPSVAGSFEWEEDILWFFPDTALDPDQEFLLSLSAGMKSADGRELVESQQWSVSIRSPDILYLVLGEHGGDLWRWDTIRQMAHELTDTGGLVIDFSPSQSGEWIVYAAENGEGGSDLWVVDRNGNENTLLLSCGLDYCSQPDWSPDGAWIAYVRQFYNPDTQHLQAVRVWTVNVETKDTAPLYQDDEAYGQMPSFSPDGQKLASYDIVHNGIRVLDLATSQESIIPSSIQEMADWSADGKRLLFIDLVPSALEPEVTVYIADLENETVLPVLGGTLEGASFSQPRWSPDGEWIAISLRPINASMNRALWVLKLDGSESIPIGFEPSATYSAFQWDPWGGGLVYQRLSIGAGFDSSIWIWDREIDDNLQLIKNGARPQWLP